MGSFCESRRSGEQNQHARTGLQDLKPSIFAHQISFSAGTPIRATFSRSLGLLLCLTRSAVTSTRDDREDTAAAVNRISSRNKQRLRRLVILDFLYVFINIAPTRCTMVFYLNGLPVSIPLVTKAGCLTPTLNSREAV